MSTHAVLTKTAEPLPLYYQLAMRLRQRIERGELAPGDRLPAEPDLAREYGLSRGTVREALSYLAREGFIERHHGRGTFVRQQQFTYDWNTFQGLIQSLRAQGRRVLVQTLSVESIRPDTDVARSLGIGPDGHVIRLKRLILADDQPITLSRDYLIESRYPGLAQIDFDHHAVVEILESRYGVKVGRRERWVEPITPTPQDQHLLGLPFGMPCLLIDTLSWAVDGTPAFFTKLIVRGDRCRHHIQL